VVVGSLAQAEIELGCLVSHAGGTKMKKRTR
jgi:hypothetical protein